MDDPLQEQPEERTFRTLPLRHKLRATWKYKRYRVREIWNDYAPAMEDVITRENAYIVFFSIVGVVTLTLFFSFASAIIDSSNSNRMKTRTELRPEYDESGQRILYDSTGLENTTK